MDKQDCELLERAINRGKIDWEYVRKQNAKKPPIIGVDIPFISALTGLPFPIYKEEG